MVGAIDFRWPLVQDALRFLLKLFSMKTHALLLFLVTVPIAANAQKPIGARALSSAETQRAQWPRFARVDHNDYVGEFAALQFLLRNQGFYQGVPDGTFSSLRSQPTENAVKAFQRAKKITVDGIVGPETWQKLCVRLRRGDKGDAVRALQTLLNTVQGENGKPIYGRTKVDGVFSIYNQRVLKLFQRESSLVADGVVGPQTWAMLLMPVESH